MNSLNNEQKPQRSHILYVLGLCIGGLLVNILVARLVLGLNLPLYLDNIGSSLAAVLGSSIPGIVVGFLTNLINSIDNLDTAYYGFITVLIAIFAAFFARRGFFSFRKPWRLLVVIVVFALIGGGLGSVLTWTLYDFSIGSGVSADLARSINAGGHLSEFWSQVLADFLIDLIDKAITVLVVAAVYNLIPNRIRKKLYFTGWRQNPPAEEEDEDWKEKKDSSHHRGASLSSKITVLMSLSMIVIAAVVIVISFTHYRNSAIEEQLNMCKGVVYVASEAIDPERVDEFLEKGEEAEGYLETEERLAELVDSYENIAYVYVYRILEDGCHVVLDPDTSEETGADPGEIIPFDEAFRDYLPALLAGEEIDPVISNETYGWLLTYYKPLYNSQGECQCYVAVDVNMDHIAVIGYQFLARMVSLFLGFFLLILAVTLWLAKYNIILPINTMDKATGEFAYDNEKARAGSVERIKQLNIHTGDEIENLYHSVVKTTEDTVQYIEFANKQSETVNRFQNGLILVLADMVESRDQNTGDHVRKTAAYTEIIMRQLKKDGIYTDQLTDEFITDVFHYAPLHDVGKIAVSDVILNKPGKLTDEEFEIMKSHTTAGAAVIDRAIKEVSGEDSGYLSEARNLALYHHEKWNGQGYPEGLTGENIPLSARIMAVADVFDALVSKRSYKDGFPFETAISIIEEGSGTHFDPQIVKAFLEAKEEVREVMESHMD